MPSPEAAATRMPAVQAVIDNAADNKVERSPRREGREGNR